MNQILYIHDDGNCTCAAHAGAMLSASIAKTPNAQFHTTTTGTWERFTADDIRVFGADDIHCDRCTD